MTSTSVPISKSKFNLLILLNALVLCLLIISLSDRSNILGRFGGLDAEKMGHTWGEMYCDDNLCVDPISGQVAIGTTEFGTAKFYVEGGNVGIGVPNPQETLEVAGAIKSTTRAQFIGNFTFQHMQNYHDQCTPQNVEKGREGICVNACHKKCQQDYGYSGGLMVGHSSVNNIVQCLCIP